MKETLPKSLDSTSAAFLVKLLLLLSVGANASASSKTETTRPTHPRGENVPRPDLAISADV
jgi:hypothetical protein